MADLSPTAFKIAICVARQTIGWDNGKGNGGRKEWDKISLSQFEKFTGMTRPTVNTALQETITKGVVERQSLGYTFQYRLVKNANQLNNLTSEESLPDIAQTSKESLPKLVKEFNTQKKGNKSLNKPDDDLPVASPAIDKKADRDGRWLLTMIDDLGFMYRDAGAKQKAIQLEQKYSDAQLMEAGKTTLEAHNKKMNQSGQGINAPLAYMSSILANNTLPNGNGFDKSPQAPAITEIDLGDLIR